MGGSKVAILANYLFGKIKELQAEVDILTERSKKTGVIFGQLPFALKTNSLIGLLLTIPQEQVSWDLFI